MDHHHQCPALSIATPPSQITYSGNSFHHLHWQLSELTLLNTARYRSVRKLTKSSRLYQQQQTHIELLTAKIVKLFYSSYILQIHTILRRLIVSGGRKIQLLPQIDW